MDASLKELEVGRKVYKRLMWFMMALFICAYLDRINVSFAALSMNKDLGLTMVTFGIASSIFYVAYVVAEIPSNMIMQKVGAKIWIPRIMITWGLATIACMFAYNDYSLYVLRALVGLAEAGFLPAMLLYMTYWFPESYRARASTMFIMAQPITILFGSALSGGILQEMNGVMGLAGWKWLFILTGIPSVLFGIAAYFYFSNGPDDAKWLTEDEKNTLKLALSRNTSKDTKQDSELEKKSVFRQLMQLPVVLMALCYFGLVMSLSTNSTWVPQIVREVMPSTSLWQIGLITAIPSLFAIVIMYFWGVHSDKTRERAWHVILPMTLAATGWLLVALASVPEARFIGLILVSVGTFSAQAIFWSMAPTFLSNKAKAVGIAAISVVGLLGTTVGPTVIGYLHHLTGGFSAGLMFVAGCIIAGALCVLIIKMNTDRKKKALLAQA